MMKRRLISILLILMLVVSVSSRVFADTSEPDVIPDKGISGFEDIMGSKTAEKTGEGTYTVTLSIPGVDYETETTLYNEIILMIDASISQADEIPNLRNTIKSIGNAVLTEDGKTHLTLMGFGLSPQKVMTITTPEELEAADIDSLSASDLLYGVSATNCEAALRFIDSYINDSDGLNEAVVVFTSDGQTNFDETPWPYSDWKDHTEWGPGRKTNNDSALIGAAKEGLEIQRLAVLDGAPFLDATVSYINENYPGLSFGTDTESLDLIEAAILEDPISWMELIWKDAYEVYGATYSPDTLLSASEFEHLYFSYVHEHLPEEYSIDTNTADFLDVFLVPIINSCDYIEEQSTYTGDNYLTEYHLRNYRVGGKVCVDDEYGVRSAAAATALCSNEKVKTLYLIGYPGRYIYKTGEQDSPAFHWMNPDSDQTHVESQKARFVLGGSFNSALIELEEEVNETIVNTPVNRPVVTDPISRWCTLDESSIEVRSGDDVIWSAKEGWLIDEEDRPFDGDPVSVENDPETGLPVITWNVKDDALVITDRYSIRYDVVMNPKVSGFKLGRSIL